VLLLLLPPLLMQLNYSARPNCFFEISVFVAASHATPAWLARAPG